MLDFIYSSCPVSSESHASGSQNETSSRRNKYKEINEHKSGEEIVPVRHDVCLAFLSCLNDILEK